MKLLVLTKTLLYCIVLYCIVLYCIVLHCIGLDCNALYISLINRVGGPYRKLRTRVFSILMAQARSARAIRKKQGSVTYGTDRANEVNKMFIIRLLPLPILIFTFGRSILKRTRKFPRFSLTHVVSVGF